jgi:hypothetical protein
MRTLFHACAVDVPRSLLVCLALAGPAAFGGCSKEVPAYRENSWSRDPPPLGPMNGKIVTTNFGDDTLSVLDTLTPSPPGRLAVGFNPVELEGPHHLSADPEGRFIFVNLSFAVAGSGSGPHGVHGLGDQPGYVVKLDAASGAEKGRVRVDPNPGDNTLSADGKTLFVTHYDEIKWRRQQADSYLALIDVDQMVVTRRRALCPAAHGVRLSRDGATLYATCGPDEIAVVSLREPDLPVRRMKIPGGVGGAGCQRCPYALAVAPDGTVWVSSLGPNSGSAGRGSVDVFDPGLEGGSFDPVRRIAMQGRPVFATFVDRRDTSGETYDVLIPEQAGPGDSIEVYDAGGPGQAPLRKYSLTLDRGQCLNAHMLRVEADGKIGQLVCEGDHRGPGSFVWLDLEEKTVLGAVPIGIFPDGLAFIPLPLPPLLRPVPGLVDPARE